MDQIHCYLYHLYDIGYRIKRDEIKIDDHDQKEVEDKPNTFDIKFSKMKHIINKKRNKLQKLDGYDFKRQHTNKFSLSNKADTNGEEQGGTYYILYTLSNDY